MGRYLDLLESVAFGSTTPKACGEVEGRLGVAGAVEGWVRRGRGEHTFGSEHGCIAGVVAVGLAFMLQGERP